MHSINKLLTVVIITLGLSISASISSPISIDNYDEEIKLVMERYDYTFILENGTSFVNDITLYTGIAYLFNATSLDRTHGISFGNGNSLDPDGGEYETLIITFQNEDIINYSCMHYCGSGHSSMGGTITILNNPNNSSSTETTTLTNTTTDTTVVSNTTTIIERETTTIIEKEKVTEKITLTETEIVTEVSNNTITQVESITETIVSNVTTTVVEQANSIGFLIVINSFFISIYLLNKKVERIR